MSKGYLQFLLHAHLPFIRHPEHKDFLEERWLFEAISESYLPLLRMIRKLHAESVPAKLTISFSPSLISMLRDSLLCDRYVTHLLKLIELGQKEVDRTQNNQVENTLARWYLNQYQLAHNEFVDQFSLDLLSEFGKLAKKGVIELITSPATSPFLPFYEHYPQNIWAQLESGIDSFERAFGYAPQGMWLPEAGYFEGVEHYLKEVGIKYFYSSFHGMLFSPDVPRSGIYAPAKLQNGLFCFGSDLSSAGLVWSSKNGYPSNPDYRDFYRDIGHDLPLSYLGPYIPDGKLRTNLGYKYHRITGQTAEKSLYNLEKAASRIQEHASNFVYHHKKHMESVNQYLDSPPLSTSIYSAELFGHWWYEGPQWLESVLRELSHGDSELQVILPSQYITQFPDQQKIQPVFSSWGSKGYAETWLDGRSDWIYRHLHMAIDRMTELVSRFPDASSLKKRALNQAAREVLLCQTIDWPVIMRNGSAESYARERIRSHLSNFYRIYDALGEGRLSTDWLTKIEKRNNVFPEIDYLRFGKINKPKGLMN